MFNLISYFIVFRVLGALTIIYHLDSSMKLKYIVSNTFLNVHKSGVNIIIDRRETYNIIIYLFISRYHDIVQDL